MKNRTILIVFVLSGVLSVSFFTWRVVEAQNAVAAPSRGQAFMEVRKAMKGLELGDSDFKSLFIVTKPGVNQTTEQILTGWVETIKEGDRPECAECVDEYKGGFTKFIQDQIEDTKDYEKADSEMAASMVAHWKLVADVMSKHLTRLNAYTIGDDNFTFVVLCGYDHSGNIVGIWASQL